MAKKTISPALPNQEPICEYKLAGQTVTLYPNRLSVRKSGLGRSKEESILLRSIASVDAGRTHAGLTVHTTAGKTHQINVLPARAMEIRDAIMALL